MPSRRMPGPRAEPPLGRRYWAAYFDAIATGELLLKPHTARRRAGEVARSCPYEDVAAAGLAKVKAAIKAQAIMAAPQPIRAGTLPRVEA
jgi:hypothetical protein